MKTNTNNELYIVTGAAGNLGSAIVRNLCSRELPVRAFVLRGEEAARHLPWATIRIQSLPIFPRRPTI